MTILITGASRGIGAALLASYTAAGQTALGTARSTGPETPGLLPLDMTDPASHTSLAAGLSGQPISLLVCNAGVYIDKGQRLDTGYPADLWAATMATNVTGVFLTVQSLLPNLRAAPGARIAIIASQMGSDARPKGGSYIYRASKAAALNLGRNLATDLAAEGIAVGIYHPGWVRTDMGGSGADIGTEASATGLMARFAALSPATTGCFESFDGTAIPF